MNYLSRWLPMFFLVALVLNSCRTNTEPNDGIPPGMRATINGTLWVADSTAVVQNGACLVLVGWTGSGVDSSTFLSITIGSTQTAPDSCTPNANYLKGRHELIAGENGTLFLKARTPFNVQGTFTFSGVAFRDTSPTFITNGEFNLNIKN